MASIGADCVSEDGPKRSLRAGRSAVRAPTGRGGACEAKPWLPCRLRRNSTQCRSIIDTPVGRLRRDSVS